MNRCEILAWQTLLRPFLPDVEPPHVPRIPLKALACRNQIINLTALVTSAQPVESARLAASDLIGPGAVIPAQNLKSRLVGSVKTKNGGEICDPLFDITEFPISKSAALDIAVFIPGGIPSGLYKGQVSLITNGSQCAVNDIEIEVAGVDLPNPADWSFFLNVWMNPGAVAGFYGVDIWSDSHFDFLAPYVTDLAAHGQRTAVIPICDDPWPQRTMTPYPNSIKWTKSAGRWEFDFTAFDRLVKLYESQGITRAIHCYSIIQGPGDSDESVVNYFDADSGECKCLRTCFGRPDYQQAWGAFLRAFSDHLDEMGWLEKTFIGFDEKPPAFTRDLEGFVSMHSPGIKIALASDMRDDFFNALDDLSLRIPFDDRGVVEHVPPERAAAGVMELLDPAAVCVMERRCPEKPFTTFYAASAPEHPNTFIHSPLVESRMMPWFALQGGYDGFLRWAYCDWSEAPFENPQWGKEQPGDSYLVYPGENGPVSSLRWEQLRQGIYDFELASVASANIRTPEEMIDFEQAISLACRNVDGRAKSIGDIEIARRLLIPIAERQNGQESFDF